MTGEGKYDAICTKARIEAKAVGALLMIIEGKNGSGFSVQAPGAILVQLPAVLRFVADEIEQDIKKNLNPDENLQPEKTEEPAS
jgi:hypothetical protein